MITTVNAELTTIIIPTYGTIRQKTALNETMVLQLKFMPHKKALSFLGKNKDAPFFMYYPSVIPHKELIAPEKYMAKYRGKYLPEKK